MHSFSHSGTLVYIFVLQMSCVGQPPIVYQRRHTYKLAKISVSVQRGLEGWGSSLYFWASLAEFTAASIGAGFVSV